ncbi:hypothetical protein D3C86_1860570 [compost metagenome]
MFGGYLVDGVKIRALTVEADRDDGLGARSDSGLQQRRIKVICLGIDVHIYRFGPQQRNGFGSGNVGESRCDDFISRADAQRHLGNL